MKKKFYIYPFVLFFIASNIFPLLKLNSSQINKNKKISIEFLQQFPRDDYILGPGDSLNIIISRDIELSSQAIIDGEGTVYLPKLGRVFVNGLTLNELNLVLNEAYKEFIKFPNVETKIIKYRPLKVFVEGEVVSPGLQILEGSLSPLRSNSSLNFNTVQDENDNTNLINSSFYFPTVFDAIRASGGITKFSNLTNIQIIRNDTISNGSGKITATLNFENLLKFGEVSQNIRIYDSDIIKVRRSNEPNTNLLSKAILSNLNPKFINVFVSGRVRNPGPQTVSRASVLSDAIAIAGGIKVVSGPVTFIRFEPDGTIDKRRFRITKNRRGNYKNPNLREGDLIIVGDSIISNTTEVIKEFSSPFVGIFSTYGLIKAIND